MGILTIEEQSKRGLTKYARETDGLQSVTVELQSAPILSVELENGKSVNTKSVKLMKCLISVHAKHSRSRYNMPVYFSVTSSISVISQDTVKTLALQRRYINTSLSKCRSSLSLAKCKMLCKQESPLLSPTKLLKVEYTDAEKLWEKFEVLTII